MCKGPEAEQGRAGLGGAGGKGEAPGGGGGLGAGAVGEHRNPKSGRVHPAWCLLAQGRTASPSPEDNVKSHWPLIQKFKKKKNHRGPNHALPTPPSSRTSGRSSRRHRSVCAHRDLRVIPCSSSAGNGQNPANDPDAPRLGDE